jgi:excisionase family DNA binding protein
MGDDTMTAPPIVYDDAIYTPAEIAGIAKVSSSYVRNEIKRGNLEAFRFGERLIRIKGSEAKKWIGKFAATGLANSKADIAPSGTRMASVGDTALVSVLRDRRAKAEPH